MKKLTAGLLIPLLFSACGVKKPGAEIFNENGIEVVLNPLTPAPEKGETGTFDLEELYAIDTESEEIADSGLTDFGRIGGSYFAVGLQGEIFLYNPENENPLFFCFDFQGHLLSSFGQRGQGPGEFQRDLNYNVCRDEQGKERLAVTDTQNNKLVCLQSTGELIREVRLDSDVEMAFPLPGGEMLMKRRRSDPSGKHLVVYPLSLSGPGLLEERELDRQWIPNPLTGELLKGIYYIFSWAVSDVGIYTGFQERGYDIWVFDLSGNPVRKIRKEFKPVSVPAEHKQKYLKQFEAPHFADIRKKIVFPSDMPAFHSFFCDDEGRLFVRTYEKGEKPGENMIDIFNRRGVFVGRASMGGFVDEFGSHTKISRGRLYQVEEKASGYKRLAVYRMLWR